MTSRIGPAVDKSAITSWQKGHNMYISSARWPLDDQRSVSYYNTPYYNRYRLGSILLPYPYPVVIVFNHLYS